MLIYPEQGRPCSGFYCLILEIAIFTKGVANFGGFFSLAPIVSYGEIEL